MVIYCAKCESPNSDQAPVCGKCGHPLAKSKRDRSTAPPAPEPSPAPLSFDDEIVPSTLERLYRSWTLVGWLFAAQLAFGLVLAVAYCIYLLFQWYPYRGLRTF